MGNLLSLNVRTTYQNTSTESASPPSDPSDQGSDATPQANEDDLAYLGNSVLPNFEAQEGSTAESRSLQDPSPDAPQDSTAPIRPESTVLGDFPSSEAEARSHIESIRDRKLGVYRGGDVDDLEAALKLISNNLYQSPMHFILELLQNADDSEYRQSTEPLLRISYHKDGIRFDANEIGFRKSDVEALCSIGNSSKKKSPHSRKHIGNKGIGFKSVFGVSTSVFIASGEYTFKFSTGVPLGMLAPEWSPFPRLRRDGFTSIFLQLKPSVDGGRLIRELMDLDGRLLLFLHNIKRLEIEIEQTSDAVNNAHSLTVARRDEIYYPHELRVVSRDKSSSYLLIRHSISNMPAEDSRKRCTSSEIIFAFPINLQASNLSIPTSGKPNKVYSFLPIRDYGFKFILQADFTLVSSREEIERDSEWNNAILKEIPVAFAAAIAQLRDSNLRYLWPYYLSTSPVTDDFFQHVWLQILAMLSREPMLESARGTLFPPSELSQVPAKLAGTNGDPLIPQEYSTFTYISSNYSPELYFTLESLGVKEISTEHFLDDLSNFTTKWPDKFQSMSAAWHSRLSEILSRLPIRYDKQVFRIAFVQLRNGTWASPNSGQTWFPVASDGLVIPDGVQALVVHPDAASNDPRRNLLRRLGTRVVDNATVCRNIVDTHNSKTFDPCTLPTSQLVRHVAFLLESGRNREAPMGKNMWVATADGSVLRSHFVYLNSPEHYSAEQILRRYTTASSVPRHYAFLHPEYYDIFSSVEQREWLQDNLGISIVPRLVRHSSQSPETPVLDAGFEALANSVPTTELLQITKANWKHYQRWIVAESKQNPAIESQKADKNDPSSAEISGKKPGGSGNKATSGVKSSFELQKFFSSRTVESNNGHVLLCQTCLPRESVLLALSVSDRDGPVSILAVPDPADSAWDFLEHFGVIVKAEAKALVARLEHLKQTAMTVSQVSRIYAQIHACGENDIGFIRKKFQETQLIYLPADEMKGAQGAWLSLDACIWDGPECLKKIPRLRELYQDQRDFFCDTLGLTVADLKTLVNEVKLINSADSLPYIRALFIQLSYMLHGTLYPTRVHAGFEDVWEFNIFPVWTGKPGPHFDALKSGRVFRESEWWYIADTRHLGDAFRGKVPVLAFEAYMLDRIKHLIVTMRWEDRMLYNLAKMKVSAETSDNVNHAYTQSLRGKWRGIARLVPVFEPERTNIIRRLRSVEVLETQGVSVAWEFEDKWKRTHKGQAEKGRVMVAVDDDVLKIYLIKDDMKIGCPPLELTEELSKFCEIKKDRYVRLLGHILTQNDNVRIRADLDRLDVPELEPELQQDQVQIGARLVIPDTKGPAPESALTSKLAVTPTGVRPKQQELKRDQNQPLQGRKDAEKLDSSARQGNGTIKAAIMPKISSVGATEGEERANISNIKKKIDRNVFRTDLANAAASLKEKVHDPRTKVTVGSSQTSNHKAVDTSVDVRGSAMSHPIPNHGVARVLGSSGSLQQRKQRRGRLGLMSLSMPIISTSRYSRLQESMFVAELYVASALGTVMGADFVPQSHWTSCLRSRAGHKPYDLEDQTVSTFTLPDIRGRLLSFLRGENHQGFRSLTPGTVFHIQVVYSVGNTSSAFDISSQQVEKARLMSTGDKDTEEARNFFILAAVYNISDDPEVALYPDPWNLHLNGLLSFETFHDQEGRFSDSAPALYVNPDLDLAHQGGQVGWYKYQSLKPKEIRVLQLRPGGEEEPLEGSICQVPISAAGDFIAVSYNWGSQAKKLQDCYLETSAGRLALTFSLSSALRALRRVSRLSIWADGICINQEDPREKALQIGMMGQIFETAHQVVAWLGHEHDGSRQAIEALARLRPQSQLPPLKLNAHDQTAPSHKPAEARNHDQFPWDSINTLLERPWFRRVWITQEVVLPSQVTVMCGRSEIDWDHFFEAIAMSERAANRGKHQSPDDFKFLPAAGPAYALGMARRRLKDEGRRHGLLKWFELFAHAKASVEVDKLFAFLGLAHDGDGEDFNPDYESTREGVIRRYAMGFLRQGQVMELLYRAGLSKSYQFCSWIPRWTESDFPNTISTWEPQRGPFSASSQSAPTVSVIGTPIPQCITLDGCIIDVVSSCHPVAWGSDTSFTFFDTMISFYTLLSYVKSYPTGDTVDDLLLQLPIGQAARPHLESDFDRLLAVRSFNESEKQEEWPSDLRQLILSVSHDRDPDKYQKLPRDSQVVVERYWQTARAFSRRLGTAAMGFTKGGYVGLVPEATLATDLICVFQGGRVPFIVRPRGREYTLIGECYMHGLMHGEAFRGSDVEICSITLV